MNPIFLSWFLIVQNFRLFMVQFIKNNKIIECNEQVDCCCRRYSCNTRIIICNKN